jgi:hypothetical protein
MSTHRQQLIVDAMLGDEYFNCVVIVTENEQDFVTAAVIFQCFTGWSEVRIGETDIIKQIGQNRKSDFLFDVR